MDAIRAGDGGSGAGLAATDSSSVEQSKVALQESWSLLQPRRRAGAFGWAMLPAPTAGAQLGSAGFLVQPLVPRAVWGEGRAAAPSHSPTGSRGQLCLLNHVPPAGKAGLSRTGRAGALGAPLPQPRHWGSLLWNKEGRGWLCPPPWGGPAPLSLQECIQGCSSGSAAGSGVSGPAGSKQPFPSFPSWVFFCLVPP